jgi:hypothetical protein
VPLIPQKYITLSFVFHSKHLQFVAIIRDEHVLFSTGSTNAEKFELHFISQVTIHNETSYCNEEKFKYVT